MKKMILAAFLVSIMNTVHADDRVYGTCEIANSHHRVLQSFKLTRNKYWFDGSEGTFGGGYFSFNAQYDFASKTISISNYHFNKAENTKNGEVSGCNKYRPYGRATAIDLKNSSVRYLSCKLLD